MSAEALSWALHHSKAKHSARLVLIVMADSAGQHGFCTDSIGGLSRRAGLVSEHREEGFADVGASWGNPVRDNAGRAHIASGPSERGEERRGRPRRLSSAVSLLVPAAEGGLT